MKILTVGDLRKVIEPLTDDCPIPAIDIEYVHDVQSGGCLCIDRPAEEQGAPAVQAGNSRVMPCKMHNYGSRCSCGEEIHCYSTPCTIHTA